jgi:hypothetical protein
MGSQLCCRLAILGHIVYTSEVFRLACIAFWPDTIALWSLVSKFNLGPFGNMHTLDLRFLQLSQAMDVIFPRGVRRA